MKKSGTLKKITINSQIFPIPQSKKWWQFWKKDDPISRIIEVDNYPDDLEIKGQRSEMHLVETATDRPIKVYFKILGSEYLNQGTK